ncbi:MAG: LPXTG cell wall anchor domain-containing protein [Neisseria sp.]|nr:LPXTG cell wall anchor domain-containing protein [Neisseria sp.]
MFPESNIKLFLLGLLGISGSLYFFVRLFIG